MNILYIKKPIETPTTAIIKSSMSELLPIKYWIVLVTTAINMPKLIIRRDYLNFWLRTGKKTLNGTYIIIDPMILINPT